MLIGAWMIIVKSGDNTPHHEIRLICLFIIISNISAYIFSLLYIGFIDLVIMLVVISRKIVLCPQ